MLSPGASLYFKLARSLPWKKASDSCAASLCLAIVPNYHSQRCCGHSFAEKCGGAHLRLGPRASSSNSTYGLFLTPLWQERTSIPFCVNRHPFIGWPVPDMIYRRFDKSILAWDSPCKDNKTATKSIQTFNVESDPGLVHNETIQYIPPENFKLQAPGGCFNCHSTSSLMLFNRSSVVCLGFQPRARARLAVHLQAVPSKES